MVPLPVGVSGLGLAPEQVGGAAACYLWVCQNWPPPCHPSAGAAACCLWVCQNWPPPFHPSAGGRCRSLLPVGVSVLVPSLPPLSRWAVQLSQQSRDRTNLRLSPVLPDTQMSYITMLSELGC